MSTLVSEIVDRLIEGNPDTNRGDFLTLGGKTSSLPTPRKGPFRQDTAAASAHHLRSRPQHWGPRTRSGQRRKGLVSGPKGKVVDTRVSGSSTSPTVTTTRTTPGKTADKFVSPGAKSVDKRASGK